MDELAFIQISRAGEPTYIQIGWGAYRRHRLIHDALGRRRGINAAAIAESNTT